MHLLNTSSAGLDDLAEPVDLAVAAADIVLLSFSDSDLLAFGAEEGVSGLSVAAIQLRHLRHPMSVDLWLERTAQHAKLIILRLLGGQDYWRYGLDRLTDLARGRGVALAVLPGEDADDERLLSLSTIPAEAARHLLACFRRGGPDNMRAARLAAAGLAGGDVPEFADAQPVPAAGIWACGGGETLPQEAPVVLLIFYRSVLLSNDVAPVETLAQALARHGLRTIPVYAAGLKDKDSLAFLADAVRCHAPALILTATGFAASDGLFDRLGVPVLQVPFAVTYGTAWAESDRGLGAADLAMNVVLPELDGRILAGVAAFKQHSGFGGTAYLPVADRVERIAERAARLVALQSVPNSEKRLIVVLPDYPGAPGRTGWAVGLDVPESALALLHDLSAQGYRIGPIPSSAKCLLDQVTTGSILLPLSDYDRYAANLPDGARKALREAWGAPSADPDVSAGHFHCRGTGFGNVTIALAPDRGRLDQRRADYHDPILPPRHALLAFGLWMQQEGRFDAVVHLGAHGTLEWLPGKAVALSETCWPDIVIGSLPVIYPFIVNNPGEAAQAKRRIGALTLGHLPPAAFTDGLNGPLRELEQLVDEYAAADGFDQRRRDRLSRLILDRAAACGLAETLALGRIGNTGEKLRAIDGWLCDVKDMAVRDGQHVYGRDASGDPDRDRSADAEREALLAALSGRRVGAGPAGSPLRGRKDVYPTGRNLYAADPRMLPTSTAVELARPAADEIIRLHLQQHGEMPRSILFDLWGSATLRTGGEEVAQGLALMGCRPVWDAATGRVTGIEVLPPAVMGRPRVDVTWRISGMFRDMFPGLIALLDLAAKAVAERPEDDEENPLAAAVRAGDCGARIFGSAPGTYGAGTEDRLNAADWDGPALADAYRAFAGYSFGGEEAGALPNSAAFARRVQSADVLVHVSDSPDRDLLDGVSDLAHIAGFAAAAGKGATLVLLDTSRPDRPKARLLPEAIARIVHGRALDGRFIAGQMRHGPRGAAELLEVADRLIGFAATTRAVPSHLIDLVFEAYVADANVSAFLLENNAEAARTMAERFAAAREGGFWHPRRNDVDGALARLRKAAA